MDEFDELAARLRAADPASSLPPADPQWVARIVEETMNNDQSAQSDSTMPDAGTTSPANAPSTAPSTGNRRWLPVLVAAAVAGIAAIGVLNLINGGSEPTPPAAAPSIELTVPDASLGKCAVPSVEFLQQADIAFEGTVTSIDGESVTLEVTKWYLGGDNAETVEVTGPSESMRQVLSGVEFEDGGRYLVTAIEGSVTMCGLSAPYSAEMAQMYAEAFAS